MKDKLFKIISGLTIFLLTLLSLVYTYSDTSLYIMMDNVVTSNKDWENQKN